jgi:hypothetical protein
MSATVVRSDCGKSVGLPHHADSDFEIVFARYNLKALAMLLTDLEEAGLLNETLAELRSDDEARQLIEALVATLEAALLGYPE